MDAKDNPVRGRRGREISTEDFTPKENKLNLHTYEPEEIAVIRDDDAGALADEAAYNAELAFMEEPVTIYIQQERSDNPPATYSCWVNGKGAEHLRDVNGVKKWMICGWLPVGVEVTTRRKYVEVLARSRRGSVKTDTQNPENQPNGGRITRRMSSEISFSIIEDKNPRGREWFSRIMMEY